MNEMFLNLFPGIMGMYFLFFVFVISSGNILSALIFRLVPFCLGLTGIIITIKNMGWL